MVWYSHLFKSFPQFVMIHTAKGFSVVNETEVDVFLEFSCFFFKFYFIFKLYNIVLVLPNIEMNLPQVYMSSPS